MTRQHKVALEDEKGREFGRMGLDKRCNPNMSCLTDATSSIVRLTAPSSPARKLVEDPDNEEPRGDSRSRWWKNCPPATAADAEAFA